MVAYVCVCICDAKPVITVFQDKENGYYSYLVFRFIMLYEKTLDFLVEVKDDMRSQRLKNENLVNTVS